MGGGEQRGNNRPSTPAGQPIKLTGTPAGIYRRPAEIGEDSEEIRAEAGSDRAAKGQS